MRNFSRITFVVFLYAASSFVVGSPVHAESVWDQLNETAPRTLFEDLQDAAPMTITDDIPGVNCQNATCKDLIGE